MKRGIYTLITIILMFFIIGLNRMIIYPFLFFNVIYVYTILYFILYQKDQNFIIYYLFIVGMIIDIVFINPLGITSIFLLTPILILELIKLFKKDPNLSFVSILIISFIYNIFLWVYLYDIIVLGSNAIYIDLFLVFVIVSSTLDSLVIFFYKLYSNNNSGLKININ